MVREVLGMVLVVLGLVPEDFLNVPKSVPEDFLNVPKAVPEDCLNVPEPLKQDCLNVPEPLEQDLISISLSFRQAWLFCSSRDGRWKIKFPAPQGSS